MEKVSVGKLLSETDLIDSLFHTCDICKNGRVPVSSLISYLEKMTDTRVQHRESVKKLSQYLDPEGQNCEVDLETYRHGMCSWIKQIRTPLRDDSSPEREDGTGVERSNPNRQVAIYSLYRKGFSGFNLESISVEDNARQAESERVDLSCLVEDLRHTNKRLCQETNKLQAQIDLQEDSLAALTQEKNDLLDKIRRLQEMLELQSEIMSENEELKSAVSRYQEQEKKDKNRILQLEREAAIFTSQVADYEAKLSKLISEREASNNIEKELQGTVHEQKLALQEAEEIQRNQEMELSAKDQALLEITASLGELSKLNGELKRGNEALQIHLSQTQHQLAKQSLRHHQSIVPKVLSSNDGSESDDENSDDVNVRTVPFPLSDLSTAMESSSIHMEIKEMLEDGEKSPSPLSAKEQSEMLASEDEMWVVAGDIDINDILQQITDDTLGSFMAALTRGWRTPGRKRKPSVTDDSERRGKSPEQHDGAHCRGNPRGDCWDWGCSNGQQLENGVSERFKQFLLKVKELKEENQRLQRLHDASVDSALNMEGGFYSVVSSADTRIMVLRDILQEERTQKTRLQEQVVTLKKILGIVDKKDSLNFESVKDILCRQQDKIEHLKRSNLELAEKYHKAELKITDLQEEAVQSTQSLEREKHRCSKLEDKANNTSLARHLDLREIWRLVQKDVETEYLDNQDESCMSASTEEIKKKIIQEIAARNSTRHNADFSKESLKGRAPTALPLHSRTYSHGKVSSHCCGYRCTSPSSPLVDALTIDFFNGNYYPLPKQSRASSAANDPYMNYLRLSCEDVDCMECRAYRLGLDFPSVASCPSLQLKLGHDFLPASLDYGGFSNVVTALDYNFNSHAGYSNVQREDTGEVVSLPSSTTTTTSTAAVPATATGRNEGSGVPSNGSSCPSGRPSSPVSQSHCDLASSAQHRRQDFRKGSSRWTSGTTDSFTSTSVESINSTSDFPHRAPPLAAGHQSRESAAGQQSDHWASAYSHTQQSSPAGFRRMSFLAAVDKSKGKDGDWNRRPSYRAAIDPGYLAGDADLSAGDRAQYGGGGGGGLSGYGSGLPSVHDDSRAENKTVTFQLQEVDRSSGDAKISGHNPLMSSSSLSSSSDSDNSTVWGSAALSSRGSGGQPRKLPILLEEEDAEGEAMKIPERCSPVSSCSRASTPAPTPHQTDLKGVTERSENSQLAAHLDSSSAQRSGANAFGQGSPSRLSASDDMKAYLIATGEESKAMAAQPACNAENMPAHFMQKSAERAARATSSSPASAASASPSPLAPAASASSVAASAQSRVLVPGSPPQTPRSAHDHHVPADTGPSRLAILRQNNLTRKREQMKTMKMPELSEHAESESELPASNGAPSSSSASDKKPASANTTSQYLCMPHISVTSEDNDDTPRMDTSSADVVRPPSPSDDPVTPSIPDSFLKQLGLSTANKELVNGEPGVDQLPDKQLESRFNSLSLAFKTDRLTLEKRLGIQERSRDIAEQNIDKELQGLRDAADLLNQMCFDERVQEVISKIQHHLDILEHSVARVSSRAEVFGAVQQEKRMCLAMEVMITFTENIRRLREKEQADVEEARKVLTERQVTTGLSFDSLSIGDRRSASVCAGLNNPRTTRRRSEVALPRYFGGSGSPSLHVSSSMTDLYSKQPGSCTQESGFLSELSQSSLGSGSRPSVTDSTEEPRQRFQSATANITVRNVVTNTLRRASLERQKNLSAQSSTSSSSSSGGQSASKTNSVEKSQEKEQVSKQNSQEEEAYRHGYEEGLKATLSRELTDLRDQQTNISNNLEQVMDRVETLQQEDKEDSELDVAVFKLKDLVMKVRLWMSNPNWHSASHTLRKIAAGIMFLIAMVVVIVTFAPLVPGNVELRNHGKSAQ